MLKGERLVSGYGKTPVLRSLSFDLGAHEILGIIGVNGMGKTTLLKTVMGLLPVEVGRIVLDGVAIEALPAHRRSRLGFSYTPQGGAGFPSLTVKENLLLAGMMPGVGNAKPLGEILCLFPRLEKLLSRPSSALSGGERQLLALARAMVRSPRLLLLDELTEGIQPSVTDEIAECLLSIHRLEKTAMIIADQDLSFVASLVGRALVVQKGQIVAERNPTELLADSVFDRD
ncbi:ATP-binding cassette domain-containing protein [Bradyrhizobium sp. CIAT3101]|uniref:ABC transporter ATP-binding protein n=1 Tax=Bradyrhizobium sp. CIAT3101 TaxID=439387 RepID=UPI0024B07294|nr:ATP-binding cassette domain-containing protein [Bradyrhizobium sp. CIAT3101]WFU80372.1 ATP-binding cassette domain-containing protein [Bradyrhizobium sp. CIAT3101]